VRVVAVDWSGAVQGERQRIWLAEAGDDGQRLLRLEAGRDRDELVAHLLAEHPAGAPAVIGLDFAFGFPAWFAGELGAHDIEDVWRRAASEGERWLRDCAPPFWGRPGRGRPSLPAHFRLSELAIQGPKSVFQVGGAGAVGTGSIRGMPLLLRLREAGFAVWPFHDGWPRVVEIYPRAFLRHVLRPSAPARAAYLEVYYPRLCASDVRLAAGSDHAFDAAVSALEMARALGRGAVFPPAADAVERIEGAIWAPAA